MWMGWGWGVRLKHPYLGVMISVFSIYTLGGAEVSFDAQAQTDAKSCFLDLELKILGVGGLFYEGALQSFTN